jgi:hypothetical protein
VAKIRQDARQIRVGVVAAAPVVVEIDVQPVL